LGYNEDHTNDLEVEITDLDLAYEGGKFVNAWLQAQRHLPKIQRKPTRSTSLRLLLLILVFFVPLFISTSYGPERATTVQYSSKPRCITRLNKIIINDGTVTTRTPTYVTIVVITQTAQSSSNSSSSTWRNAQGDSIPLQAHTGVLNSCK